MAMGRARRLLLAGCRPEVDFGTHERQSKIDRVVVDASVQPDGVVRVSQRYTFDSGGGGVVALPADLEDPNVPSGLLEGMRNITVDGAPAQPSGGTFAPALRVRGGEVTVAYEVVGVIQRYADIADLQLDVLHSPENASRQDPNVEVSGTLTLPEGLPGPIDAHFHGGRDRAVSVDGRSVHFSSDAPIWQPGHKLAVAFPSGLVPGVSVTPTPGLPQFQVRETALRP